MLQLKSTDHYFKIGEELLANNVSGDILIVTDTATFSAHSLLLVQHVHQLADLLCDHCREAHEEIVVIIPDVEADLVEIALKEFYLKGDSRTLNLIFNAIRIKVKDFDEDTYKFKGDCDGKENRSPERRSVVSEQRDPRLKKISRKIEILLK